MGVWGELGVGEVPNKDQRLQIFPTTVMGGALIQHFRVRIEVTSCVLGKHKNKKFPNHELQTLI